jgi:hypothetical protein
MGKENMTAGSSDENTVLTVEILSVTVDSQITACLKGKPVKLPNWEPGIDLIDGYGSKRPGVFEMAGKPSYKGLKVKVKVKGLSNKKIIKLTGKLAGLTFTAFLTGDNSTGKTGKEMTVTAVPENIPGYFKQASGDMEWFLDSYNEPFEKTRLEMYWIYGYPGIMYKKGVWVEVLRLLAALCVGLKHKEKIIQRIVNYCHAWTSLRYNSETTAGQYAEAYWGGYFNLEAFLAQAYSLCNCYDQAGALQTLLGALGIELTWIYMNPFGFINRTSLIGRGESNNPVFLKKDSLTPEIVDKNDQKRTKFGAHSFCLWEKQGKDQFVLDACLGPALGNASGPQYIKRNIDTTTKLYKERGDRPGGVKDMNKCTGIIDVHAFDCLVGACEKLSSEDKRIKEFKKRTGFDRCGEGIRADTGVCCDWQNPLCCPGLKDKGWKIESLWTHGGCVTAAKEWKLVRGNEHLKIIIFAANKGIETAKNRLLTMAASTAMPGIPFEKKPKPQEKGHLHVFHHRIEIWVFYNICFLVDGCNSSIDLHPVTYWLQEQAEQCVVEKLSDHLPVIEKVTPTKGINIEVDQEANIRVFPGKKYKKNILMLDPFFPAAFLRLVEEKHLSLKFKAKSPGKTDICLVLVNKHNLLCSTQTWQHAEIT